MVDATSEDVVADVETINRELELYDEELSKLPQILVLNKCELMLEEESSRKAGRSAKKISRRHSSADNLGHTRARALPTSCCFAVAWSRPPRPVKKSSKERSCRSTKRPKNILPAHTQSSCATAPSWSTEDRPARLVNVTDLKRPRIALPPLATIAA